MRYGEMKSAFVSVMETLNIETSPFDFANAIDDALYFLAINLPAEALADHMMVASVDKIDATPRQVNIPYGLLKPESVRIAKSRASGTPIYVPGTIVSPREFLNKAAYSEEPIISMFNGMINFNPDLPSAAVGFPGTIELVYRKVPSTYMRKYSNSAPGAFLATMDQDSASPNILTTETLAQTWEDLGLSTQNLFGGKIIMLAGTTVIIADIDYAYDDDGGTFSGLSVTEGTSLSFIGTTVSNVYVVERAPVFTGTSTTFVSDTDEPDLPEVFHRTALDYAIGKFLIARNPQVATSFMSLVAQTFQGLGVNTKIEYGGE